MDTIEYRTMDKAAWQRGPWDDEPDKIQWQDEATEMPCLINRNRMGALCGYVGVPVGHPWHGQGYDDCRLPDDGWPDVHGGLTYSAGCDHSDDPSAGICHVPGEGEPDNVWWLGFDCAHAWDKSDMGYPQSMLDTFGVSVLPYRDIAYVRREVARLAAQAALAKEPKP